MTLPEKSIALVAHSQRTRDLYPKGDDWLILGLNNVHRFLPRVDALIQIHTPEYLAAHPAYSKEDLRLYETTKIPVIAQQHYPAWPSSIPLELDELQARYGKNIPGNALGTPWVSTMTYMVGLAMLWIERGHFPEPIGSQFVPAKRFGFWGFDSLDDYSQQGPSVAFLCGIAYTKGIEVVIPKASGFLRQPWLYGFENRENGTRRRQIDTRKAELKAARAQLEQKIAARNQELQALNVRKLGMDAQIGENDYQRNNWTFDFDDDEPTDKPQTVGLSKIARGADTA